MTPDDEARLGRSRFAMLSAIRAGGVVMMLLGMWIWLGDLVRLGGDTVVGFPLFLIGFVDSLIVPQILSRRWRTPPR